MHGSVGVVSILAKRWLLLGARPVEYFVAQYRKMVEENLDDYIEHFDKYMKPTQ